MTAKKATPNADPKKQDPKVLRVEPQNPMESRAETFAHTSLRPTVQAALTLMEYNKAFGDASINTLVDDLGHECKAASDGNLARTEALLIAQAHTLDAIFNNLSRRAALNMDDYISPAETYLRLALKAQSQCRATLEALAAIKNPAPIAFVHQANIAHGPQQVNNESFQTNRRAHARAETCEIPQNKLLKGQDGERVDTRAASNAVSSDPAMATVGKVNRAPDG